MRRSSERIAARLLPLGFVIACQGETTTPTTVPASLSQVAALVTDNVVASVTVVPNSLMVFVGDPFKITAKPKNAAGQVLERSVRWTVSDPKVVKALDSLKAIMTFKGLKVGATSVKATADTKNRSGKVVVRGVAGAKVVVTPAVATVVSGATVRFLASGLTQAGETAVVSVTWAATGGTISGSGVLTAGNTPGTYRVIATSRFGAADTSVVTITAAPVPGAAPIARVTLLPGIAASRAAATTQFVATAWNTSGNSVPKPMSYETTCGTVTAAGVFTAPLNDSGACLVMASVEGKADTTEVVLVPTTPEGGVPYGLSDLWTSSTVTASGGAAYTASIDHAPAGELVSHIAAARATGVRLVLGLTGGSHDRYKTAGVFDLAKWRAAVDAYNTPAIRAAIADGVSDGTIIGNSVMDEPQQSSNSLDNSKSWGPPGTMTKARVDDLCAYVKFTFPTLPAGVGHDFAVFEPNNSYRMCDFLLTQYAWRKTSGNIGAYRDAGLAFAARDGMAIIFSLNVLDGGIRNLTTKLCPIPQTGGPGTYGGNCRMTPAQVRDWGKALGRAGCALLNWRSDAAFLAKPENQEAISDVAITLSSLPRKPCTRPLGPPPLASTTTAITGDSPDPSDPGAPITVSFTVTSASGTPTGTVQVTDPNGGSCSGSAPSGSCSYTPGGTGTRTISATYQGNSSFNGSSDTEDHTVTQPPAGTTTTITDDSPDPSDPGVPITVSFTVTSVSGTPTGTVQVTDQNGGGCTGSAPSDSCSYTPSGTGTRTISATYPGNSSFSESSDAEDHTVTSPPPTNTPPVALFDPSCAELTCTFTDESTDDDGVIAWSWDFGDGSSSTERNPDHTYEAEDSYQVTLVVTDADDATGTVTQTVTATAPPAGP